MTSMTAASVLADIRKGHTVSVTSALTLHFDPPLPPERAAEVRPVKWHIIAELMHFDDLVTKLAEGADHLRRYEVAGHYGGKYQDRLALHIDRLTTYELLCDRLAAEVPA